MKFSWEVWVSLNMMTLCVVASGISVLFTLASLILAMLAYANVIGMKRSTHRMISSPSNWQNVPFDEAPKSPEDDPEEGEMIQDLPQRKSKPMSIAEQMSEYVYPDVSKEQV